MTLICNEYITRYSESVTRVTKYPFITRFQFVNEIINQIQTIVDLSFAAPSSKTFKSEGIKLNLTSQHW